MNVEIGTWAAQFPEKEYINGIFIVARSVFCMMRDIFIAKTDKQGDIICNAMEAAKGGPVLAALAAVICCQLQLLSISICTQTAITILRSSLAWRALQYSLDSGIHRKKRFTSFPSPAGMSLTKLPLGRNNLVMTSLFPPRESLVVTSRLGTGNSRTFFYGVPMLSSYSHKKCMRWRQGGFIIIAWTWHCFFPFWHSYYWSVGGYTVS